MPSLAHQPCGCAWAGVGGEDSKVGSAMPVRSGPSHPVEAPTVHSSMKIVHGPSMRRLPPFDSLIAFEAVLRHGSMTAAAAEMGVTQSAISHRLRRLEAFMGVPLLRRSRPSLAATPPGQALAAGLHDILGGMAELRERCRAANTGARLRVGVGGALAHHWLVRRLPLFAAAHVGIEVDQVVLATTAQAKSPDLDVRVLWMPAKEARSTSTQQLLFHERVFPVCHPKLLGMGPPGNGTARLASLPLIQKAPGGRGGQPAEWEWVTWFERLGIVSRPTTGLRCDNIDTAISAALEGAGVVLARSLLVHDALAEGRLVRLLEPRFDMPSSKAHVASWPRALTGNQGVRDFVAWLARAAEATVTTSQDRAEAA